MGRISRFLLPGLALLLLVPAMVHAQASITGVVRDASGAVLPGVTVEAASAALIEKVRSVVSDGTGQYRIENLRPGVYTLTFTLPGFSTVRRDGIELTGSFTASVNAELRVGALEETITVTGETPVVDVQSTTQQRVLNQEILDTIPANRYPSFMAALIPAVNISAVDVGGNVGNPVTGGGNLTVHGSRATDVAILRNGVSLATIETGSNTQGIPNMAVVQELAIDTSTVSAERTTGGVAMNFVPREGGNTFAGTLNASFAGSGLQGDNFSQELQDRGLKAPNSLKQIVEINPAYGGPIVQDKLWFFGTALYSNTQNYAAGMFRNRNVGDLSKWTYEPDESSQSFTKTDSRNGAFRLTWQANQKNKLAFSYEDMYTCQCSTTVNGTTAPEAAVPQSYHPNGGWSADWTAPLTNRILLEAVVYRRFIKSWRFHPEDTGLPDPIGDSVDLDLVRRANLAAFQQGVIGVQDQTSGISYRAVRSSIARNRSSNWPQRISMSYVTGAHSFKVGYMNNAGHKSNVRMDIDAPISYRFRNGVPNRLTLQATPYDALANLDADLGLYAQDRWTLRRMTLDVGVRYDHLQTSFPEQYSGPGLFVPNRDIHFAATDGVSWHDISPRLGMAYDLFGTGKTALKVTAAKYMAGQALRGSGDTLVFGDALNPIDRVVNSTNRSWNDANRNFIPDCDLLNPARNGECGAMSNSDFGSTAPGSAYDPAVLSGWGKRVYNWQFSAGVQQEVLPRMSVDFGYFRRVFGNFNVVDDRALTAADFDRFSITAPSNPDLPGGGGYAISGLYDVNPAKFGVPTDNYITFANDYGKQIEHWNGVDLSVNARPRQGVLLQGGMSTGRTTTNNCEILAKLPEIDPLGGPYCDRQTDFLTSVKFIGAYTIPRVDVQVAGTFQSLPGPEIVATYPASNAVVAPSLGRNLAGSAANVEVNLVEPGTLYGERRSQFDMRFGKIIRTGRVRTSANLDVYNLFNANPVLTENPAFGSFRQPTSILPPRVAKFTFQLDF